MAFGGGTSHLPQRTSRAGSSAGSQAKAPTRVARKEATRQQILAATIEAIAEGGLADLTLTRITDRAEVSRGLVNFHFDSKEQLLVETLEFLTLEYLASWQRALERAGGDAGDRLLALVQNDFHPSICNRKKVAVWFAFRGESKSRPTYLEVCNRADGEFTATIVALLETLKAGGGYRFDAVRAAHGLGALIEGLWLDCLMYPQAFRRNEAIETTMEVLTALMPKHFKDWRETGEREETSP